MEHCVVCRMGVQLTEACSTFTALQKSTLQGTLLINRHIMILHFIYVDVSKSVWTNARSRNVISILFNLPVKQVILSSKQYAL